MGLAALPIAAVAVTAIATATAAAGEYAQSQAQSKAAAYNAQMEQYDATIQKQQGQEAATEVEEQGELIQGKARAAAAAAGLDGGSSTDVSYNDLVRNDQAAYQDMYRGQIGAYNATSQAGLDTAQSGWATQAGGFGVAGTLLSGASKAAGQFSSSGGGGQTPGGIFGSNSSDNAPTF